MFSVYSRCSVSDAARARAVPVEMLKLRQLCGGVHLPGLVGRGMLHSGHLLSCGFHASCPVSALQLRGDCACGHLVPPEGCLCPDLLSWLCCPEGHGCPPKAKVRRYSGADQCRGVTVVLGF